MVFAAVFLVMAFAVWRQRRWGYLGGGILSLVFLLLSGFTFVPNLANPASPGFLWIFTLLVATSISVPYGVYGFLKARRPATVSRQISREGMLALLAVGFLLGGTFIGLLAGATLSQVLPVAPASKDVIIVPGADNLGNGLFFVPDTLTVKLGKTVVWFNSDLAAHTITSTTGVFDSKNLDGRATYEFTFTQPGSYEYFCQYHPWMKGKIVVQSG